MVGGDKVPIIYSLKHGNNKITKKVKIGFPFRPDIEEDMKLFYDSLNEKDRRHYAALGAKKLCYGGVTYKNWINSDS